MLHTLLVASVLGFLPGDNNRYIKTSESRMALFKHNFEDVSLVICDETSMVASSKLLKINYRLQDVSEGAKSKMYMVKNHLLHQVFKIFSSLLNKDS